MVARWGSEQFAVLIGDVGSAESGADQESRGGENSPGRQQAAELAERLADAIDAAPFTIDTNEVWVTASVGVATSPAASADQVLGNAHLAMIKAARAGGARVKVFGTAMAAMARRRIELAAALGEAVTDHQLQVVYQPIVELATSLVTGVEAVFSWCQAGERIEAAELLAVAEESGLIVELGDWLLREAVRQVARWRAAGPGIGLTVHVSARQLSAPGFAASVLSALDAAGLPTQALTLAVDEGVLMDGGPMLKSELAGLRGTGVRIAIDDFGTGQASLSYLRQLSIDVIKIGSSLTAGLGTDPTLTLLTSAISGLGRDLGIETIAAGVDRPDQAELLQAMGCGLGQGGWLARQLPAGAVEPIAVGLAAGWTGQNGSLADGRSEDEAGDPACSPAS
jgi:EAL domain-containing protein (putative c-di-GMP-specific phosphodiesterase class I)